MEKVIQEDDNFDLTARGVEVTITPLKGGKPVVIGDFPDDLDPITIDEAEFADIKMDANGEWFRQQKPTPISMHLSIIPGSNAEAAMNDLIKNAMFGNSEDKFNIEAHYYTESNKTPIFKNKIFKKGYMTGCSLGYSATSQGRVRTKQFNFKFPLQNPQ